jgi:lipopolysaccharide transport system permease protein
VAQPLVTFAVLAVFFGAVLRVEVDRYPEFLVAGLVAWMFVQRTIGEAPSAVRGHGELLRLSAFPRMALPVATVAAATVDFAAQLAVVSPILVLGGGPPPTRLLLLPALVVLIVAFVLAASIALAGITVRYRDVAHLVPLALTLLFYAAPVVYPPSLVPAQWQDVYHANPVAVLVQLFRATLYGSGWPPAWAVGLCVAVTAGGLAAATAWYRRASDRFVAEA